MRAVRDGTSRAGISRPALLGSRTAVCEKRTNLSAKTSDVSELSDSEFYFPKKRKKKKEKCSGHMINCLLTELGRAGRENIWPSVMAHGPSCARSVHHDIGPNIFSSVPPTRSISTYYHMTRTAPRALSFQNY